jgi:hypothetical protein
MNDALTVKRRCLLTPHFFDIFTALCFPSCHNNPSANEQQISPDIVTAACPTMRRFDDASNDFGRSLAGSDESWRRRTDAVGSKRH